MSRIPNGADVLDFFGDRQICGRCGATVSTYSDRCTAPLDEKCEGVTTYEDMLEMVGTALARKEASDAQ